jgi:hypothetical protein
MRNACEQIHGREDLPRLAIPALRDVLPDPGALHRMQSVATEALDGSDGVSGRGVHRQQARARRRT